MRVLVVNAGSSSLKLSVLDEEDKLVAAQRNRGASRPGRRGRGQKTLSPTTGRSMPSAIELSMAGQSSRRRLRSTPGLSTDSSF